MASPLPRECSTTELKGLHCRRPKGAIDDSKTTKLGAGEGNRTLVISLEGFSSTIELHPRGPPFPRLPRLILLLFIATYYPLALATTCCMSFTAYCIYCVAPTTASRQHWWRGLDSNQRTLRGQIYSLLPLTTRPPLRREPQTILECARFVNSFAWDKGGNRWRRRKNFARAQCREISTAPCSCAVTYPACENAAAEALGFARCTSAKRRWAHPHPTAPRQRGQDLCVKSAFRARPSRICRGSACNRAVQFHQRDETPDATAAP